MTPDDVREEIELKVVELLKAKLEEGAITEERSQSISQMVLDVLQPGMNWETLYQAIFKLDDACSELSPVVLPYAQLYETQIAQKASSVVSNYIKLGQYDAAIKLADDVVNERVKLQWSGSGKP